MRPGLAVVVAALAADLALAGGFEGFWGPFRAAVVAGDADRVAAMTRTPFLFEGKALDAAGFRTAVPRLFDAPIRDCFRTAQVVDDGAQRLVFCRGTIFVFAHDEAGWRLTELGVDD